MPQFRSKRKASGENQSYPIEPGSNIKSGPFPKGQTPLKKNVNEVKVKLSEPSKPAKKGPEAVPPTSGPDMCNEAERVLKETED